MYQCPACLKEEAYKANDLCWNCTYEQEKIRRHNRAAKKAGLVHDLTIYEWRRSVTHFDGKCAYCGRIPDLLFVEHFIPLTKGGGTTISNCVPACYDCNSRKRNFSPEDLSQGYFAENVARVKAYLDGILSTSTSDALPKEGNIGRD